MGALEQSIWLEILLRDQALREMNEPELLEMLGPEFTAPVIEAFLLARGESCKSES